MKKLIKEYRVELVALLIVLVGVFLLVEQFDIRTSIIAWINAAIASIQDFLTRAPQAISTYFSRFTLSDLVGWVLIISTLVFILWRIRYRFQRSDYWRVTVCPNCGSSLHRIHRRRLDRVVSIFFLPDARRYLCSNKECNWSGLRHRISHRDQLTRRHSQF